MSEGKLLGLMGVQSPQMALLEGRLRAAQNVTEQKQVGQDPQKAGQHDKEIEKAATQFEALLVQEMIKEMWATVPKGGLLSDSSEENTYQDMYQQALSQSIAEHQSIGVKDVIIRDIKATEARAKKAASNDPEGAS